MNVRVFTRLIATSLLPLLACVSKGEPLAVERSRKPADLDALHHRAQQLWAARQNLDCPTIFIFENHDREDAMGEAEFVARCRNEEPLRIVDYDLSSAEVDGELGWVRVVYHVHFQKAPGAPVEAAEAWEKWYKIKGEWFPVPKTELPNYPEPPSFRDAPGEASLRNRFLASWEARRSEDWHRLYELSDPLDHDAVNEATFVESESMFHYLGVKLVWVEVIGERGKVRVTYQHKVADPSLTKLSPRSMTITEKWVARDGTWYRDLKRP